MRHHVGFTRIGTLAMGLRHLVLFVTLALPLAASAQQNIQSVDAGLQPLYTRMDEVRRAQLELGQTIQDPRSSAQQRAQAKTDYQALEVEKKRIEKEISRAQWLQKSAPMNYGTDPSGPASAPDPK